MRLEKKGISLIAAVAGLVLLAGFSWPPKEDGWTWNRRPCTTVLKVASFKVPTPVTLADDLLIQVEVADVKSAGSLKAEEAFMTGTVEGRGGFQRPVDNLYLSRVAPGRYQGRLSLGSWATKKNLWPLIEKAQREWLVDSVQTRLTLRFSDLAGCRSEPVSAETQLKIGGFTRNTAIRGFPPEIVVVDSPPRIRLGDTFVIQGKIEDQDRDLPKGSLPIKGFLTVGGLPGQFPLPPNLRAYLNTSGIYEVSIGPKEFGFYNRLLQLWPAKDLNLTIHSYVEDRAGHVSNMSKIDLRVTRS